MNRNRCPHCDHCRAFADPAPGGKQDTSVRAAAMVRQGASAMERTILGLLEHRALGAPLTANKLAELSGLPLTTVRPRLTHLQQIGKIEDSGQRMRVSKKTSAILWRLT